VESTRRPLEIVDLFVIMDQWKGHIKQLEGQLEVLRKQKQPIQ
jgi:hypothetical protein